MAKVKILIDVPDELSELEKQSVIRAKLLGRIYYSHSPKSVAILDCTIDEIIASVILKVDRDDCHLINCLADFFKRSPLCSFNEDREMFFVDVLFEKYNHANLARYLGFH